MCALLALVLAGCDPGQSAAKKMQGKAPPTWPALEALKGPEGIMTVGMSMDREGPKTAQKAAAAPTFKQLVDDFEKAPIPSSFATSEREAAKKELVASLRKLAEGGPDDELEALYEKARESMKILSSP